MGDGIHYVCLNFFHLPYLRFLNHLSFLGYQIEIMNDDEIKKYKKKKVVKQCIIKLDSHQYHRKEVVFSIKIGYF
ncbi:hypothetical protein U3516DRAFT_901525, partial [Neocallimastix sp. 'constans']